MPKCSAACSSTRWRLVGLSPSPGVSTSAMPRLRSMAGVTSVGGMDRVCEWGWTGPLRKTKSEKSRYRCQCIGPKRRAMTMRVLHGVHM